MDLRLLPFPRLRHPAPGMTHDSLPVTRDGVRRVAEAELARTEQSVFGELTITDNQTGALSRGLCGLLPAAAFLDGRVRPHEQTLAARLTRQEATVRADAGGLGKPVLLTVPSLDSWWSKWPPTAPPPPDTHFAGTNNHYALRLWPAQPAPELSLTGLGPVCIADGHHRAETHARLAAAGRADCGLIPVCLIGWDELRVDVFARHVQTRLSPGDLLDRLAPYFDAEPLAAAHAPRRAGEWLLRYAGRAYRLERRAAGPQTDAGWFNGVVLPAVFGITNVRADVRVEFLPLTTAAGQPLAQPANPEGAEFVGFPVKADEFFAEIAAGRVFPPKSTRFEPRVPSGLVVWEGCRGETD